MRYQYRLGIGFLFLMFQSSSPPFQCTKSLVTQKLHESEPTRRLPWIGSLKAPIDTYMTHGSSCTLVQFQQRHNQLGETQNISTKMQAVAVDLLHES